MSFLLGSVKEFRQHQPFTNIFLRVLLGYKTYVSLEWLCDRILITGRKTAVWGRMRFPKSKRSGLISKPWCPIRFTHSPHCTEHGLMLDCEAATLRFERTNCAKCLHVDNARENKKKEKLPYKSSQPFYQPWTPICAHNTKHTSFLRVCISLFLA